MVESKYSPELTRYLGRIEIDAFREKDKYYQNRIFRNALENLTTLGLSGEEFLLARQVLARRAHDTEPSNIGIASGDGGAEGD